MAIIAFANGTQSGTASDESATNATGFTLTTAGGASPTTWSPGDWFGWGAWGAWPQSAGIPFALADDSVVGISGSPSPGDTLGIIDGATTSTDEVFGIVDTVNNNNTGDSATAEWTFDISGFDNLSLSIDFAAMGDFELSDSFVFSYAIDGGALQTVFQSSVDEAGSQTYTMEGGAVVTLDDPLLINGAVLNDVLQTLTANLTGTGSELTLNLTASTNGADEGFVFDNILIEGDAVSTGPAVALEDTFDDASQFTVTQGALFTDGFGDYFTVTDGSTIGSFVEFTNPDGGFLAAQDVNGEGGPATVQILYDDINIAGLTNLNFSGLFAEDDDGTNQDWDADSSVLLEYSIDGGAFQNLLAFEATGGTNSEPAQDTDFDGIGDGTALTDTFQEFTAAISGTGSSLDLRITLASLEAGDEDIAIDNVMIVGDGDIVVPETTIAIAATDADRAEGDAGSTDFVFTITRSGDTSEAGSVDYAVSGDADDSDFGGALPSGTVNFAAGETSQTLTIAVSGDVTPELDEGFTVTLSNATNGAAISTATANGTIRNDDGVLINLISEVQGSGNASPLLGSIVTVEAVVVGDFQDGVGANGDLNGFYLQEEDGDADSDPLTSEGIFVFDGFSPAIDVQVGDRVQVTGTVDEFFGETQIDTVTAVTVLSSGNQSDVTPATIMFPVASTVTNSDGVLIADLEAYEGMLVTIPQELTVSDVFTLGRFGDIGLHADGRLPTYTQTNAPSVAGFQAYQDLAVRNTVILDDGSTIQNPDVIPFEIASAPGDVTGQLDASDELGAGDTLTDLTGVVRFGRGSGGSGDEIYRINPTADPVFENDNPRPTEAPDVGGDITVASFNVLNFFTSVDDDRGRNNNPLNAGPTPLEPRGANDLTTASTSVAPSTQAQTDPLAEFDRQLDKLVSALSEIEADIFGLVELENEFPGFADPTNLNGQTAVERLISELNAVVTTADYQFAAPSDGSLFGDTGDAITVGLIYDANTVELAQGTTVEVLTDADLAGLGFGSLPAVFDGSSTNRAPIAATFEEIATGETFTISVNHFKSKGSPGPAPTGDVDIGDGVGNANQTRLNAATVLDAWLDTNPTGSADEDVLIIGDLNAYAQEDPIQFLFGEGFTDLAEAFATPGEFNYSFGFPLDLSTSPQVQGFGTLDYGLASASLSTQVTGAAEWHINADEASIFDYNLEFRPQAQADGLYGATPFRSSDHDPLVIGLDLSSEPPEFVAIYDIQGAGHVSTFDGQEVTTEGVITAIDNDGYYIQDTSGDGDNATSDAIFVFTGFGNVPADLSVGNLVSVEGTVREFTANELAFFDNTAASLTTTGISPSRVSILEETVALPAAIILGSSGRLVPEEFVISPDEEPTDLTDPAQAHLNFDPDQDGIDFFESVEGMRVTVEDAVAVSATNRFSETWAVTNQGDNLTPDDIRLSNGGVDVGIALAADADGTGDLNPERIQIQTNTALQPSDFSPAPVNNGSLLGDVTGVVGYSFGNYEVQVTEAFTATDSGVTQETTALTGSDDQLTVATYNILNVTAAPADGDGPQIAALAQQIVNNLGSPDIIGLQEVQDDSGVANDGTLDATATLQTIVDAIAAAGGPTYAFESAVVDVDGETGGVPGGNIRNAFLYNPDRVTLQEAVTLEVEQLTELGIDDPTTFDGTRDPLLGTFLFNGNEITVVNNHLTSRFGSTPIYGSQQPFTQAGEANREAEVLALNQIVAALLVQDPTANVVVLGDLNTFDFTNDLTEILPGTGDDQILTNLITDRLVDDEAYTFIFQGNSQVLDHVFVTDGLLDRGQAEIDIVHVNNDFATFASDHEPVVTRFTLPEVIAGTDGRDRLFGTDEDDVIAGLGGNDKLFGKDGDDLLLGGDGKDRIFGGDGDDTAYGQEGDDRIWGNDGNDMLFGNEGRDRVFGGDDDDTIRGGDDNDRIYGQRGDDRLFGDGGDDRLNGGSGDDELTGGEGDDRVDGGSGDDIFIFGVGDGNDTFLSFDLPRGWDDDDDDDDDDDYDDDDDEDDDRGGSDADMIDLSDFGFTDVGEVAALFEDQGRSTVIQFDMDTSITLVGVETEDLLMHMDVFILA